MAPLCVSGGRNRWPFPPNPISLKKKEQSLSKAICIPVNKLKAADQRAILGVNSTQVVNISVLSECTIGLH